MRFYFSLIDAIHSAYSENGSVNKEIFFKWYQEVICVLYPDIENAPGKRVLIKSDGGPGRTHQDYLAQSNLDGLVHYPGLPNGTFFQELDQIFAYLKTIMEENRKRIWDIKFEIDGHKAKVSIGDFAKILFGGKYTFTTGVSIDLRNAFAEGLSKDHLDRAARKCGYAPATRVALESKKLRHEIVTNLDGDLDQDLNDMSMTDALLQLEKMNHECIIDLEAKGYKLAASLKRSVNRRQNNSSDSNTFQDGAITVPGTSEYQRALVQATTQGKHFQVTNGGAPMNSDDWICAAELKAWDVKKEEMQKKKKLVKKQRKVKINASKGKGDDPNKWTLAVLKSKIHEKDPTLKTTSLNAIRKTELINMWINDYSKRNDHIQQSNLSFTKKEQKLLKFLEKDKILNYEKTGIYKRAVKGRLDFLVSKADHIPRDHALALAMKIIQDRFESQEDASIFLSDHFGENYTIFVDNIGTCIEVDSSSSDDKSYYSDDDLEGEELEALREEVVDEVEENDILDSSVDDSLVTFQTADELNGNGVFTSLNASLLSNATIDKMDKDCSISVSINESVLSNEVEDKIMNEDGISAGIDDSTLLHNEIKDGTDNELDKGEDNVNVDALIKQFDGQFKDFDGKVDAVIEEVEEGDGVEEEEERGAGDKSHYHIDNSEDGEMSQQIISPDERAIGNVDEEPARVSPASSSTDSVNESLVTAEAIDALAELGATGRLKLKELYEKHYGSQHPNKRVHTKTLVQLIKVKL